MEDFNVCASTSYKRYAESDSDEGDAVNPNDFLKIRATINKRQKVDNGNASLSAAKEFHSETEDDLFPLNSREDFINAAEHVSSSVLLEARYLALLSQSTVSLPKPAYADDTVLESLSIDARRLLASIREDRVRLDSAGMSTAEPHSAEISPTAYVLPVVKTAVERKHIIAACGTSVRASATSELKERTINITTRLNGKHTWNWRCKPDSPFSKLSARFAEVYGVKSGQISFSFDGDNLRQDTTPSEAHLEDEDLIDVKVDRTLFEEAVASAELYSRQQP